MKGAASPVPRWNTPISVTVLVKGLKVKRVSREWE
jgi:hypothetical protein